MLNLSEDGKPKNQSSPLRLTLLKPNKVVFDAGLVRMVSDGKDPDHVGRTA